MLAGGTIRRVDADSQNDPAQKLFDVNFQATYAYRRDGNTALEISIKPVDPDMPMRRKVAALNREGLTSTTLFPGRGRPLVRPQAGPGGAGSLMMEASPERLLLLFYWRSYLDDRVAWDCRLLGREPVGDAGCVKLRVDRFPEKPGARVDLAWIDLRRGGHVLKLESYNKDALEYRLSDVRLAEFPLKEGGSAWLPVHGVFESFLKGHRHVATPVMREVHDVVRGSVALNQDLGEDRFSIDWQPKDGPGGGDAPGVPRGEAAPGTSGVAHRPGRGAAAPGPEAGRGGCPGPPAPGGPGIGGPRERHDGDPRRHRDRPDHRPHPGRPTEAEGVLRSNVAAPFPAKHDNMIIN